MIRLRRLTFAALALAVLVAVPAWAQPDHRADLLYQAQEKKEKHTDKLEHGLLVSFEREEKAHLCLVYGNNSTGKLRNKGSLIADVDIARLSPDSEEPVIEEIRLRGQIRGGAFIQCAQIDPVSEGDVIAVEYTFNKMPRLREQNDGTPGAYRVVTVLSEKELTLRDFLEDDSGAACEIGGDDGGDSGGRDTGDGGANNTANNQRAAQILRGCAGSSVGIQFQWDKGRQKVDRRDAAGNIATIGPFASYLDAALAADSRWKCGSGNSVSADDGAQMNRLLTWGGVSGRRLALRFESSGGSGVYVDAYSSAMGAIHGSRFSTIGAAIRNFCGRPGIGC